jgi:hypothetical protein
MYVIEEEPMKKFGKILGFTLIVLSVFACELPSSVEVKGSPELKFAANMDFSEMFANIPGDDFGQGIDGMSILDAENSGKYKTFVIRMELFNETIESPINGDTEIVIGGNIIDLSGTTLDTSSDVELFDTSNTGDEISLPFSDFGEFLEGFKVSTSDIKASLYFGGSSVVEKLNMDMTLGSSQYEITPELQPSGISSSDTVYEGTELPPIPNTSQDMTSAIQELFADTTVDAALDLSVYFPQNTSIEVSELTNASLSAELVIWVPLSFEADGNDVVDGMTGTKKEVEELNSAGEFISELAGVEVLESMDLSLGITAGHPFDGGYLLIQDKNDPSFVIKNAAGGNSINIALTKEEIDRINEKGDMYEPELSIFFPNGKTLGVPKTLGITSISVKAGISVDVLDGEE